MQLYANLYIIAYKSKVNWFYFCLEEAGAWNVA